jgi:hypothetical protein
MRRKKHIVDYNGAQLELFQVTEVDSSANEKWSRVSAAALCVSKQREFFWLRFEHRIFRFELPKISAAKLSARDVALYAERHPEFFERRAA